MVININFQKADDNIAYNSKSLKSDKHHII